MEIMRCAYHIGLLKKNVNVVTFYMIPTLLINHIYHHINNNKTESSNLTLLEDIINRNNYLENIKQF